VPVVAAESTRTEWTEVRELTISVPRLAEQDEIVRRIDQLKVIADGLTQRIDGASNHIDHSAQAVLAIVSSGDLSSLP